jgi:hypothetical protein
MAARPAGVGRRGRKGQPPHHQTTATSQPAALLYLSDMRARVLFVVIYFCFTGYE